MAVPSVVEELVERFEAHRVTYQSEQYNEAQLRGEFINPLFEALGWDVYNKKGYAEAYKEVIHEAAIKIGGRTKAPDYCFRAGGGQRSFFVEAKKPSVDIGEAISPAYQLRRYAWSAKLPVSILTDFEEFAVYDCRIRPDKSDKAATARVMLIGYREYLERWDELFALFSPEAIRRGSLERFVASKKIKKGTAEVDKSFLEEIESWRNELARNIALRNPELDPRDLNFAVQRTIDRIIFLRICEDRGIESYGTLESLQSAPKIYRRLAELFQRADDRYNSGLFHFTPERDRPEPPDEMTLALEIDDKPLKEILRKLYFPESPYEFSVFPIEILGQVYEQFLGKVIRLTAGHQAKVEEKPEVRKAGGVYYTPTYIVDYIVKHTVGKLLEGAGQKAKDGEEPTTRRGITPKQAEKLRILDPACGSGSFLIGAYTYLLDWHRDWYLNDGAEKHAKGRSPKLYQSPAGDWRLTTAEKKRILLNNIYGVDIDPQAVEVTKLSLLLKVLEGESAETLANQLLLFHERALPDLGANVKCGNSLIGRDFFNGQQLSMFDDEERFRLNVFDWQSEFPEVFKAGGFDAVIGNPPYVRIQTLNETQPETVEYFRTKYLSACKGNYDIYILFIEKGLSLLNIYGLLGFICPHKFFNTKYGESLRTLISTNKHISQIVHFGHQQVFSGATTYTCLLLLCKDGSHSFRYVKVDDLLIWKNKGVAVEESIDANVLTSITWTFNIGNGRKVFEKLKSHPVTLGHLAERMAQGIRTSANDVYVIDIQRSTKKTVVCISSQIPGKIVLEPDLVHSFLQGKEIKAYSVLPSNKGVIIPYEMLKGKMTLVPEKEMRKRFPRTLDYLLKNKSILQSRERHRMKGALWYGYVYPKNLDVMTHRKILVPDIADRASFALDEDGRYAFTSGYGIILREDVRESDYYVLGLLNSKVLDFYLKNISTVLRGGYFRYFTQYIENLPVPRINFADRKDKARHDRMVRLVETMLMLNKKLSVVRTGHDKTAIRRQIDATDRQIDRLVYELYGLTEEEIAIVEQPEEK
ncbi:MAG: Eco57I restriction-modification methylase domain-containing protein [Pirellulales bacterium]|nr:Eco57I restriction-modification methylase domain-containing protein [Pirellulales bacterium]